MQGTLTREIKKVLDYFHKLYKYKSLYVFPYIQNNSISPILTIPHLKRTSFNHHHKMGWLNYYQNTLTKENIDTHLSIGDFFNHFELDILFPVRKNGSCFGFLGVKTEEIIKDSDFEGGEIISNYLASVWKSEELINRVKEITTQSQAFVEEITSLLEISRAIESGGNIQELLEFIMQKCMKIMNAEAASLMLMDDTKNELEFKVALGPKGKEIKPYKLPVGQGIGGWVAKEGKALLIPDAYSDERFDPSFDEKTGFKTKSILCVPLIRDKKVLGVVQVLNHLDGNPFTTEDKRNFTIFASIAALAIENSRLVFEVIEKEKLEKDIAVATEIQRLIIPKHLPKVSGLEMSGIYIPSKGIGGDFYSVFPLNEHETVLCIADVTGKGISGALLVSTLHATLKAYLDFTNNLVLILNKLNNLIDELSTSDKYITLFIGKYDTRTKELTYINAGHNPPILISKNNDTQKLKKGGVCVGVIPFEYEASTVKIERDDVLVLYTDGVIEAMNDQKEKFNEDQLVQAIVDKKSDSCEAIQDEISLRVLEHCGEHALSDDFTLFIIKAK